MCMIQIIVNTEGKNKTLASLNCIVLLLFCSVFVFPASINYICIDLLPCFALPNGISSSLTAAWMPTQCQTFGTTSHLESNSPHHISAGTD